MVEGTSSGSDGPWRATVLSRCLARVCGLWLGTVLAGCALPVGAVLDHEVKEPRAFGWQVGDRLSREVLLSVPAAWVLDRDSLPRAGRQGGAVELVEVALVPLAEATADWQWRLRLTYQIFLAPEQVASVELPRTSLRFDPVPGAAAEARGTAVDAPASTSSGASARGAASATTAPAAGPVAFRELRIEAWPVLVSPLLTPAAPSGRGGGELRPDRPPPLIPDRLERRAAWLGGVLLALGVVGALGRPLFERWWLRRALPMARAARAVNAALHGLPAATAVRLAAVTSAPEPGPLRLAAVQQACRALHRGLDDWAGRVVLQGDLDGLLKERAAYAPLQADLQAFFAGSQALFFGAVDPAPRPGAAGAKAPLTAPLTVGALRSLAQALAAAERADWGRRPAGAAVEGGA